MPAFCGQVYKAIAIIDTAGPGLCEEENEERELGRHRGTECTLAEMRQT